MRRVIVTLSIPVEDEEATPAQWNWSVLLDTTHEVNVLGEVPVPLLPSDRED